MNPPNKNQSVFVTTAPDLTVYVGGAQAVGKATHAGAFTKVTSDMSNIATGEVEGPFTMTVANGDQVTGVYGGFIFFGSAPGSFSWRLNATVTGGTGRSPMRPESSSSSRAAITSLWAESSMGTSRG